MSKHAVQEHTLLRQKLDELAAAKLPAQFDTLLPSVFMLRTKTPEGRAVQKRWLDYVTKHRLDEPELDCDCPPKTFLALLQAELLAPHARRWEQIVSELKSPKRKLFLAEPVLSKRMALYKEMKQDEAERLKRASRALCEERDFGPTSKLAEALAKSNWKPGKPTKQQRQKEAHRKQDETPLPTPCLWSKRMTIAEYKAATGHNRKTIARWLRDLEAEPKKKGRHAAEADRYSVAMNLKILARWIERWPDAAQAKALAAETLAYTEKHDPGFVLRVARALHPALERRKLHHGFIRKLAESSNYYNPPSPSDPLSRLLLGA